MLEGYKTYIFALIAILIGVLSQIFGWFDTVLNIELIMMGLIAGGLRRAISNGEQK